jgi:CBS domain-containing protein
MDAVLDHRIRVTHRPAFHRGPWTESATRALRPYHRGVRARDLAEPFPTVNADTDALVATRMLAEQGLPGLVVLDSQGRPLVILAASQVLRFAIPEYIEEDPGLAGVIPEATADQLCSALSGKSIAELMPAKEYLPKRDRDRPIVAPDATALQIASVMSYQHSPMVAVMDGDAVLGVITVHRLLGALLPHA